MKRLMMILGGVAVLAVAGCGDSDDPVSPSSSPSVAVTTTTSSSAAPAPSTPPPAPTASIGSFTVAPSDVPSSLTLDLEGTPCNGVNDVDFDGKHFECVDGVFRAQ